MPSIPSSRALISIALAAVSCFLALVLALVLPVESQHSLGSANTLSSKRAQSGAVPPELPNPDSVTVLNPVNLSSAPTPSPLGIEAAFKGILKKKEIGSNFGISVVDTGSGREVYSKNSMSGIIPASTTKILTGVSVLTAYGDDHRLTTPVVRGSTPNELVIVGSGNPLLINGSNGNRSAFGETLQRLAKRTAKSLKATDSPTTAYSIRFDDSLFTGPSEAPSWQPNYVSDMVVGKISALSSRKNDDPFNGVPKGAADTAKDFAKLLRDQGVKTSSKVSKTTANRDAEVLGEIQSAPLTVLTQQMMELSDNTTAEALAHLAGAKLVGSGSFTGGAQAAKQVLTELGIETTGLELNDGSGLSRKNRISARTLSQTMSAVAQNQNTSIWAAGSTLPVAGLTGTLRLRFVTQSTQAGRGVVRGKTGSLSEVVTLSGLVTTRSGGVLAYTFLSDKATYDARNVWDKAATALSKCGCQ